MKVRAGLILLNDYKVTDGNHSNTEVETFYT